MAPIDLEVTILDPKPWGVREGRFDLNLRYRRRVESSIYSPPSWCPDDERWRFQLGYLLRFILTGNADFTGSVRPTSRRGVAGELVSTCTDAVENEAVRILQCPRGLRGSMASDYRMDY